MNLFSRDQLLSQHSRHRKKGETFSDAQVRDQLTSIPDWSLLDQSITRTFDFGNYYETLAFVNAIAYVIHHEDHHPDMTVGYNRCTVQFSTHSAGGISLNDFICAAKCDAVFAGTVSA